MAAKNDITGDSIQTKVPSDSYRENYDRIFGKPQLITEVVGDTAQPTEPQILSEDNE